MGSAKDAVVQYSISSTAEPHRLALTLWTARVRVRVTVQHFPFLALRLQSTNVNAARLVMRTLAAQILWDSRHTCVKKAVFLLLFLLRLPLFKLRMRLM